MARDPVPELGKTYRVYYRDCPDYDHLEDIGNGMVAARFTIKLHEPNPEFDCIKTIF